MFLPTTAKEMRCNGWSELDIILVSGDSYIDSAYMGIALIGKFLAREGFRVGVIGQPDITRPDDITRLGEPRLFWGVSGGAVDSMVANYTAIKSRRKNDDYTPGGLNNRRPDRAVITYANLIRRYFKRTRPLVLGGIEASLRRVAHYDYWSNSIRGSILFDAKADYLIYGMAEAATLNLARCLDAETDPRNLAGLCYISPDRPSDAIVLPDLQSVKGNPSAFTKMFHTFYRNCDAISGQRMVQQHDTRYLVHNPPAPSPTQTQLDNIYDLDFEGELHPYDALKGDVSALETIRFSIATHRGCYGECNFCSITAHQGQTVSWRSETSIVKEARRLIKHPKFKGYLTDIGGPTANMFGFECPRRLKKGSCDDKRCLAPKVCRTLGVNHSPQTALLKRLRNLKGIKQVFVASGVRHDMVLADLEHGSAYLEELVAHHVSGQLKIAPEHTEERVLHRMGKPASRDLLGEFRKQFIELSKKIGKEQYLTYYLIAAHPGCSDNDMRRMAAYIRNELHVRPEQVQIFTPLPSTYSALMYHTGRDPFSGREIAVEKGRAGKLRQKMIITEPVVRPTRRSGKAKAKPKRTGKYGH